jgi:hypothetical protein
MEKGSSKGSKDSMTQGATRRVTLARLNALAVGALATIAASATVSRKALAATEKLAETDPIAIALGYKIIATSVDTEKYPKRAGPEGATQFCVNCALFSNESAGYGACTAIPGKLVAAQGWCNAWIPKA